ncbi:hypothetical protein VTO42DRAFT_3343 [Malbranchea cinnamomea]
MIELGLSRITRLVQQSTFPWRAIHIAGTNGKGSIAGYLSTLLTAGGVRCGAFTSPHLIDRWDCITINDRVVHEALFRRFEDEIKQRNECLGIGATEFELLTATAFEIFRHEQVEIGVVEVGMGGRLDATNVLENVLVSVIAKIGYDHQAMLGDTIEKISGEKAGILKKGVPCFVDGSNIAVVQEVIETQANKVGSTATFVRPADVVRVFPTLQQRFEELELEPHQQSNLSCAIMALRETLSQIRPELSLPKLFPFIPAVPRAGRLQQINLEPLIVRDRPILLDGAHNPQSASVLSSYVDRKFRPLHQNVTWVVAASQGKDIDGLFRCLIQPGDRVAVVEFGPVQGMPWVRSVKASNLLEILRRCVPGIGATREFGKNLTQALDWASTVSPEKPLVVAGSLYLVSDILRLQRGLSSAPIRS